MNLTDPSHIKTITPLGCLLREAIELFPRVPASKIEQGISAVDLHAYMPSLPELGVERVVNMNVPASWKITPRPSSGAVVPINAFG